MVEHTQTSGHPAAIQPSRQQRRSAHHLGQQHPAGFEKSYSCWAFVGGSTFAAITSATTPTVRAQEGTEPRADRTRGGMRARRGPADHLRVPDHRAPLCVLVRKRRLHWPSTLRTVTGSISRSAAPGNRRGL